MSSQKASPQAKAPRRERGHARVESLLEAAGETFAEKGYEAATMTAIAKRAGASIGSLYQFFPTKELVAKALLDVHIDALKQRMLALRNKAAGMEHAALARALLRLLKDFRRDYPGFVMLAEAPGIPMDYLLAVRGNNRAAVATILEAHLPDLTEARARVAAYVVLQLMKTYVALAAEPAMTGRTAVLAELETVLTEQLTRLASE
ncbi:TetR family transcriptional regulator [Luteibacter rhizovicinus]|uniref:TetR family transcriptional regulator n=1 Tax=Luteibacter rhizovicinus TaxID=242606 RepID=A0A4R3YL32_9GAMM|nr:TetR/AcrR family transcriptional regulator [Luteibacter rhizovicinus]TCV93257.1 TetR family transcriptional regulator [Luteibacter rhizovicinus]